MKLATFDNDSVGIVIDDQIVDVSDLIGAGAGRMRRLIADYSTVRGALEAAAINREGRPLGEVVLQAPVPDPGKIIAAPVNYHDHQQEMKETGDVSALGLFLKSPTSVLEPGGQILLPYTDRRFDHEAEVAVIIGRRACGVEESDALDYVFGYTGLLDITMRGGEDRSTRKSFDTFTPCGPWLVTADEFGDPTDADFTLCTNGAVRQHANTRDLIWGVARFVAYASSVTTLLPGDVISTGTPAGVSPIHVGDMVTLDVARVGRLSVTVGASNPVLSPTSGHSRHTAPTPVGR